MNLWCMSQEKELKAKNETSFHPFSFCALACFYLTKFFVVENILTYCLFCSCLCAFYNQFFEILLVRAMRLHAIILQLIFASKLSCTLHCKRIDYNETFRYFKLPIAQFMRLLLLHCTIYSSPKFWVPSLIAEPFFVCLFPLFVMAFLFFFVHHCTKCEILYTSSGKPFKMPSRKCERDEKNQVHFCDDVNCEQIIFLCQSASCMTTLTTFKPFFLRIFKPIDVTNCTFYWLEKLKISGKQLLFQGRIVCVWVKNGSLNHLDDGILVIKSPQYEPFVN